MFLLFFLSEHKAPFATKAIDHHAKVPKQNSHRPNRETNSLISSLHQLLNYQKPLPNASKPWITPTVPSLPALPALHSLKWTGKKCVCVWGGGGISSHLFLVCTRKSADYSKGMEHTLGFILLIYSCVKLQMEGNQNGSGRQCGCFYSHFVIFFPILATWVASTGQLTVIIAGLNRVIITEKWQTIISFCMAAWQRQRGRFRIQSFIRAMVGKGKVSLLMGVWGGHIIFTLGFFSTI